jgi:carbamoyl-phosphate synthase small subunit
LQYNAFSAILLREIPLDKMKKGKLVLKDGTSFEGEIFGAEKSSAGELVFSTGMVGYPESITDPSYEDQILVFTYPLIGNYGAPEKDKDKNGISTFYESEKVHVKGVVTSEYSKDFSHWNAKKSFADHLKEAGVPGISGIDTRELTKILRSKGSQPAKIIVNNEDIKLYDPNLENLVAKVSIKKPITYNSQKGRKKIIVIDCGVKNNTLHEFLNRGITIRRVPWNYDFFAAGEKFDGVFISNGPGNPALLTETINIIKKCLDKKIPTFGICLGNQLIAHAAGGKTYKMKFGNRSQNQPCIETETKRCYMTTQNHGYAVERKSLPKDWEIWFENVNDKTIEGIRHKKLPFMAVQFHPEACPGPVETSYLFDVFVRHL